MSEMKSRAELSGEDEGEKEATSKHRKRRWREMVDRGGRGRSIRLTFVPARCGDWAH